MTEENNVYVLYPARHVYFHVPLLRRKFGVLNEMHLFHM